MITFRLILKENSTEKDSQTKPDVLIRNIIFAFSFDGGKATFFWDYLKMDSEKLIDTLDIFTTGIWKKSARPIKNFIRKYKDVFLVEYKNSKYVVKKISDNERYYLDGFNQCSSILYPIQYFENNAVFKYIDGEKSFYNEFNFHESVFKSIAKIHSMKIQRDLPKLFSWSNQNYLNWFDEIISKEKELNIEIPNIKSLKKIFSTIDLPLGITHGDFLPFNILLDKAHIKIYDWEHVSFDFSERDIGRYLSDLNPFHQTEKRYYPEAFYNDLLNLYLNERKKYDSGYDIESGRYRVKLGEVLDYWGVITACVRNQKFESWFYDNLQEFKKVSSEVVSFL
ncbi:MAG: hypothetical protein KAQ98_03145 [Bacteriovoracaceae bacterium]|nr:hypothetical protein [Bacteriovoracaceae bacterium]